MSFIINSPLEQFQIINLIPLYLPFGIDLSLTNSALVEILGVLIIALLLRLIFTEGGLLIPTN
jgi:hypothetical protein